MIGQDIIRNIGEHFFMTPKSICIVSGGFDPVHIGHKRYFADANKYGALKIIINSDEWLIRKKGYVFMPWEDRRELLEYMTGEDGIYSGGDDDGSVCSTILKIWREYHLVVDKIYFAKGGDRTLENTPEVALCEELGIECVWGCGGGKIRASSELVREAVKHA